MQWDNEREFTYIASVRRLKRRGKRWQLHATQAARYKRIACCDNESPVTRRQHPDFEVAAMRGQSRGHRGRGRGVKKEIAAVEPPTDENRIMRWGNERKGSRGYNRHTHGNGEQPRKGGAGYRGSCRPSCALHLPRRCPCSDLSRTWQNSNLSKSEKTVSPRCSFVASLAEDRIVTCWILGPKGYSFYFTLLGDFLPSFTCCKFRGQFTDETHCRTF